jgi:hypothetical protein
VGAKIIICLPVNLYSGVDFKLGFVPKKAGFIRERKVGESSYHVFINGLFCFSTRESLVKVVATGWEKFVDLLRGVGNVSCLYPPLYQH